ncbi:MAG: cation-translocating P-type ATPase [Bacteroidota bacterium]
MNYKVFSGLNDKEVLKAREQYGINKADDKEENRLIALLKELALEPMSLLLLATSGIYILMGRLTDSLFMIGAIAIVTGISLYQNARSRSALKALGRLMQPTCRVYRNNRQLDIKAEELVLGDIIQCEEGSTIPADAEILEAHDFTVNEAILTGESLPVGKNEGSGDLMVYQGTAVTAGLAVCRVIAIGSKTRLGLISKSMGAIVVPKTPLQLQINRFVRNMVIGGLAVLVIVWGIHFFESGNLLESLLKALTLAMSIVPEEIPVAFTTFMAIGAWRLIKEGILVKQTQTVETLGSATVICTDKTGTITENRMELANLYVHKARQTISADNAINTDAKALLEAAMWASEPEPFDAMEKALHAAYGLNIKDDKRPAFRLVHEYPLGGRPPMMTHVFEDKQGIRHIAAKGALEAIIAVSVLNDEEIEAVNKVSAELAGKGFRILGVAESGFSGNNFPENQQDFDFSFLGMVAFYDPPKKNIGKVFKTFYDAGIKVKIITGDNALTTGTLAASVGFTGADKAAEGEAIMKMDSNTLRETVQDTYLFTRMFPEAKLRVINALKEAGEVVAMTGDGVNDGPALKAAHIGIAMGNKGTEIARDAAGLVLLNDDFEAMVKAVALGRRIYINLKKAVQYIISIHIPIILTVILPLMLNWVYPAVFLPVHIIFLELVMGPTCSIVFENEPMEKDVMLQKPRPVNTALFGRSEMLICVLQGLAVTLGTLSVYYLAVQQGCSDSETRSMVFLTLISANIFITFVSRTYYDSVITALGFKNPLMYYITGITSILTLLIYLVPSVRNLFALSPINAAQAGLSVGAGFVSVIWFEAVKMYRRQHIL